MSLAGAGYVSFPYDQRVADWARAAYKLAQQITANPKNRARNLRHGGTWFVGVDALPTDASGAVAGVALAGPWDAMVTNLPQHPAQLSVIYPGYPQKDAQESDANHQYRKTRAAAHVDGLLPVGPDRRRFAREYHAYVLGIPLNACNAAPTVVWPGSHRILGAALRGALTGQTEPEKVDVTEIYHAARRAVFETGDPVALRAAPGESFLIHRHALHGTSIWNGPDHAEGRMIAFFRPEYAQFADWLAEDV